MSNQFGHNRDRRQQSQMQAAASGLAALGRRGSINQFGGGRPIQQQSSLAGSAAGNTVHGASAAAVGAYGSMGSAHHPSTPTVHPTTPPATETVGDSVGVSKETVGVSPGAEYSPAPPPSESPDTAEAQSDLASPEPYRSQAERENDGKTPLGMKARYPGDRIAPPFIPSHCL